MQRKRKAGRHESDGDVWQELEKFYIWFRERRKARGRRYVIRERCAVKVEQGISYPSADEGKWMKRNVTYQARMRDLSAKGGSFYTRDILQLDTSLCLTITLPSSGEIVASVRIRWCKWSDSNPGYASVGFQFTRMSKEHRAFLRQYLARLDEQNGSGD